MGALDGVRVLDLSIIVQGPQAGQMLADLGADVIKVELPGRGDAGRNIGALTNGRTAAYFFALNRGKRSITLDLRTDGGRTALKRLVETSDVVLSNFRPGTLDEWGLGYDDLAAVNPRIIWAAGSAFGPVGPDAEREGADLSGQAAGGLVAATGENGGFPSPAGAVIADHSASQNLAVGILAALFARERTGRGQRVEASLLGGQVWAQASELTYYLLGGVHPGRANRGHPIFGGLWQVFETKDRYIAMVGAARNLWPGFCRAIERPDLEHDPRFAEGHFTDENRQALLAIMREVFLTRTTDEWCARLRAEGQRYAPVNTYREVATDPQVFENGYLFKADHPEWGEITVVGSPIRLSDTPTTPAHTVAELGQHTEEVLLESGFSWEEIEELRGKGAF